MSSACLTIRTGLQGNGKTLNTIKEVDAQAKKEGRIVYFHNVTGLDTSKLKAQWFEFEDPKKWFDLPNDSIIVIDEAQGWFGARDPRASIPEHLSRFETMRKQGHEVHLITQDPRFLDVHARRLCNCHIHYWRIFGSAKVSRYEMPRVKDDVEKISNFKDASRTIITLDKNFFGVYSSAQAKHHFNFKPSRKAVFFFVCALVALVLFYRAYQTIFVRDSSAVSSAPIGAHVTAAPGAVEQATSAAKSLLPGISASAKNDRPKTKAEWLADRVPRIPDDPASAPIYDDLTKPQSYPRLSCVASYDQDFLRRSPDRMSIRNAGGKLVGCQCYTQQGSKYQTSFGYCLNVVKNGYFDPAKPDPSSGYSQAHQPALVARQPIPSTTPGNMPRASSPVASVSAPSPTIDSPGGAPAATYVPAVVPGAPSSVPTSSGVGIAWIH